MTITFYATLDHRQIKPADMDGVKHVLLPASSWESVKFKTPNLPAGAIKAADSGAFRAMLKGRYSFTIARYVEWLDRVQPAWAATRDWVCADATPDQVLERQQQTTEHAYELFRDYRDVSWSWVPVIQGWTVPEYQAHARELLPLIRDMQRAGHATRVGIGSLKVRENGAEVSQIVYTLAKELPGVPFHLFGVSLKFFRHENAYFPQMVSIDTSLWDGRCGLKERHKAQQDQQKRGMTRMEHGYQVALPDYLARFEKRLGEVKQQTMWEVFE